MPFLDAVAKVIQIPESEPTLWIRPLIWRRQRVALVLGHEATWGRGRFLMVPDARGGRSAHMPVVAELLDEWEVVDPNVVNAECEDEDGTS